MTNAKGWRKLGFGAAIVLGVLGFIYWKTSVIASGPGAETLAVPDIPNNVRDVLIFVFASFAGANVAEHFAKRNG